MSSIAKVRVDGEPSFDGFLLRAPVPCTPQALAKPWVIDGEVAQRDIIARAANGDPSAVMLTVKANRGGDRMVVMADPPPNYIPPTLEVPDLTGLALTTTPNDSAEYTCKLIGEDTFRYVEEDGPFMRTEAHWARFVKRDKKILGVWTFISYRADGLVTMTIHPSNAAGKATKDGVVETNGTVFFDGIKLVLPDGWSWMVDQERPSIDVAGNWLLQPLDGEGEHSMIPREHFHRRIALYRAGDAVKAAEVLQRQGQGFVEGRASYYSFGYGPTDVRLPEFTDALHDWGPKGYDAALAKSAKTLGKIGGILESGEDPGGLENVLTEALGWAHPIGVPNSYAHGGWWIYPFHLHWQTRDEMSVMARYLATHAEREPMWALDADTGYPLGQHDFGASGEEMSFQVADTLASHLQIPGFHEDVGEPFNQGFTPYRQKLNTYPADDAAHGVRNTLNAKAMVWGENDAYSKLHLRAWAEHFILARTTLPHESWGFGNGLVTNYERLPHVMAHPHEGGTTGGRTHAWIAEGTAMYYAIADPAWRTQMFPWFEAEATILDLGVMENGIGGWTGPGGHVHHVASNVATPSTVTDEDGVAQSFEIGLFAHGVMAQLRSVWRGIHPEREAGLAATIVNSARFLHGTQLKGNEPIDDEIEYAGPEMPPWYIAVRDLSSGTPHEAPAPRYAGGGEGFHGHFHLLYAYLLDGRDEWYLQKVFNLVGGPGPRGDDESHRTAVREGAWYADKIFIESSGWNNMLRHAAPMVRQMQREWARGGRPPGRGGRGNAAPPRGRRTVR